MKKYVDLIPEFDVYSCTENSALNEWYNYIPFEEFLEGKRIQEIV